MRGIDYLIFLEDLKKDLHAIDFAASVMPDYKGEKDIFASVKEALDCLHSVETQIHKLDSGHKHGRFKFVRKISNDRIISVEANLTAAKSKCARIKADNRLEMSYVLTATGKEELSGYCKEKLDDLCDSVHGVSKAIDVIRKKQLKKADKEYKARLKQQAKDSLAKEEE